MLDTVDADGGDVSIVRRATTALGGSIAVLYRRCCSTNVVAQTLGQCVERGNGSVEVTGMVGLTRGCLAVTPVLFDELVTGQECDGLDPRCQRIPGPQLLQSGKRRRLGVFVMAGPKLRLRRDSHAHSIKLEGPIGKQRSAQKRDRSEQAR